MWQIRPLKIRGVEFGKVVVENEDLAARKVRRMNQKQMSGSYTPGAVCCLRLMESLRS